jgi:hypothetical protein
VSSDGALEALSPEAEQFVERLYRKKKMQPL